MCLVSSLTVCCLQLRNNAQLAEAFKEVGVPISLLQSQVAVATVGEDGAVDLDNLLSMVETAQVPILFCICFDGPLNMGCCVCG